MTTRFSSAPWPCADICAQPDGFQADTGYIDSFQHPGIDTRPDSRLRFRMTITCAPIPAEERHSSYWTHSPPRPGFSTDDAYRYYYLGPTSYGNFTLAAFNSTLHPEGEAGKYTGRAIFNIAHSALFDLTLQQIIYAYGSSILLAHDMLFGPVDWRSAALPETQWRDELANMAATIHSVDYIVPPADDRGGSLCRAVRVRDMRYYDFSVAGLAVVVSLGSTAVLVNLACIPAAAFWAAGRKMGRRGGGSSQLLGEREWHEGSTLALLWKVFDKHGVKPWQVGLRSGGDVPMLQDRGQTFSAQRAWTAALRKTL
ncbi:hypothetical protein B0T24DRAFT_669436 [Lasiosphaeria ovina]|uniref:Uncharacterized protein n=1 Tax=Lasiosphaeria ovina TaxID=92902 RepID=A0AAE0JZ49_9PEZI|nr:hypothetical protein B0T24DRAFT_669436 [Lasiosphaeria ovina]